MINARLRFSKTFGARYMSHLDLMRCFTRAVRRSGLPVWYTEGFNSHLYITFAAPLALGFESICEAADIRLLGDLPEPYMPERINSGLPFGVEVFSAGEAVMKSSKIAFARYIIEFGGDGCDGLADRIALAMSAPALVGKRTKSGAEKLVDVAAACAASSVFEAGGLCFWDVTLAAGAEDSVSPKLAVQAVFPNAEDEPEHLLIKRTQLLTRELSAFE